MLRNLAKLLLGVCLLLIPVTLLTDHVGAGFPVAFTLESVNNGTFTGTLESYVQINIPFREELRQWGLDLRLFGGSREQNGIFISADGLMKNFDPPNDQLGYIQRNTDAIISFAGALDIPAYAAIIPTACAVRQQILPDFAQPVNQKAIIDGIYTQMTGHVVTADIYSTLFNRRDEYIYYRTDDRLTALGGFYAYGVVGQRLGLDNRSYSQFDILYVTNSYDGPLYRQSPYKDVHPDSVQALQYSQAPRVYTVDHWGDDPRTYHTLYPVHLAQMGRETDICLGGLSAVTDIRTGSPVKQQRGLLVFCDNGALPFVSLLANHYSRITLVDTFQATGKEYARINLEDYDQVLFAYGIETYAHTTIPSRVRSLAGEKGLTLEALI